MGVTPSRTNDRLPRVATYWSRNRVLKWLAYGLGSSSTYKSFNIRHLRAWINSVWVEFFSTASARGACSKEFTLKTWGIGNRLNSGLSSLPSLRHHHHVTEGNGVIPI